MADTEAAAASSEIPPSMSISDAAAMLESRLGEQDAGAGAGDALNGELLEDDQDGSHESGADHEEQDGDLETGDAETTDADESTDDEGPSIETLSDLAEALGQPLEDVLANLTTTITVDGEQKQVTLKDAFDGYNLAQASKQRMQQVAEDRRRLDTDRTQHLTEMERQHQVLGTMVNNMRQLVVGQVNTAEMEALKAEDPGRYAQMRLELEDRLRSFDQMLQQGAAAYDHMGQGRTQEEQQKLVGYVQAEREKLSAAIPEWSEAEGKKIAEYLASTYQYEPAQLDSIVDHRTLVIARKAMLYDQLQEKAKTVTAKVKQLPKLQRPGQKQAAIRTNSDALKKVKTRFSQTNKLGDAAAVLAAQMGSSR